jgi:hypothetical protein
VGTPAEALTGSSAQRLIHCIGGGSHPLWQCVAVTIHSLAEDGVAEDLHHGSWIDTLREQERRAAMAQVVQPQPMRADPVPQLLKASIDVPRLHRRPERGL